MVDYSDSSVFNASAETIVNTVNCVGVMGAGLALEFKLRYPDMYIEYKRLCKEYKIKIGNLHFYKNQDPPKYIINFPTKQHWKYPSNLDWIEQGLQYFLDHYKSWNIKSVAFPRLGCDLGGMDWNQVKPIMQQYLSQVEDVDVVICSDSDSNVAGAEQKMLQIMEKPELWQDLIIPSYIDKILRYTPVTRFKNLQKPFRAEQYRYLFNFFYDLALTQKEPININLDPREKRLTLITLFKELELTPEQMCELTWQDLQKHNNKYWLSFSEDQKMSLLDKIGQELESLKQDCQDKYPILHNLKQANKKITISTVKTLIKEISKIQQ